VKIKARIKYKNYRIHVCKKTKHMNREIRRETERATDDVAEAVVNSTGRVRRNSTI